jgi:hypothetical protein
MRLAVGTTVVHESNDFPSEGFRFFSREEPRAHVHVHHSDGEAKFWINPQIELAHNWGLNEKHLREARDLIEEHSDEIRRALETHFGG